MREFAAHCITSAADVRELLGLTSTGEPGGPGGSRVDARPATDDGTRVRDALSTRVWRDADDLSRRTGMAREDVEGLLGLLQLEGEVVRSAAGWRMLRAGAP
jgi:DNA processing protein